MCVCVYINYTLKKKSLILKNPFQIGEFNPIKHIL